jgi:hypothetical protein
MMGGGERSQKFFLGAIDDILGNGTHEDGEERPHDEVADPMVTVIVAAYNCKDYIGECITSLRAQTLESFECIIIDDASDDGTIRAAAKAIDGDGRFSAYTMGGNVGPGAARNQALAKARGRYVMYVDADDSLVPRALEKLVARADAQELDELYFSAQSFYEDGAIYDVMNEDFSGRESFKGVATGRELFTFFSDRGQYFPQGALRMVRRELLEREHIRFPEGIIHEDVLYGWRILVASQRSSFLNEPLYLRRQRAGSIMGASRRTAENVLGHSICVNQIRAWVAAHASELDDAFLQAAGREVGQWCQCIARDWAGLDPAERAAFTAGLTPEERLEFNFFMLGAGQAAERAAAEWRESQTYKLGDAVARLPRALRIRLRALLDRRKAIRM